MGRTQHAADPGQSAGVGSMKLTPRGELVADAAAFIGLVIAVASFPIIVHLLTNLL